MFKRILATLVAAWLCVCVAQAQENGGKAAPTSERQAEAVLGLGPAEPSATPGTALPLETRWEVRTSDVTLSKTVERWTAAAGHKLKWDAARNFLIGAPDVYVGTFEGALQHLLSSPGIRHSDYPLEACVYANTPPLVRITRQGEQSRECAAVASQ